MCRTFLKKAVTQLIKLLPTDALPKTRTGDYLSALRAFVETHNRLPTDAPLFNDQFFRLTTSNEIQDPLRVFVTDKEYLKWFVSSQIGDEYIVPTMAILKNVSDIDKFEFPARCVIKPTHLSGTVILRRGGEKVNRERITGWFEKNWYLKKGGYEVNYRNLIPKVIVEEFVFDQDHPNDYKIFCVKGVPKMIEVDVGRMTKRLRRAFYTAKWERLPFCYTYKPLKGDLPPPDNLALMLDVAKRLSKYFSLIRVDLYSNGKDVCVGELTNCPAGALAKFNPREGEELAGQILFNESAPT